MLPSEILKKYRIRKGNKFRLADIDPSDTCDLDIDKSDAKEMLAASSKRLSDLQERLNADRRWALLAILQGMDAAGKDGAIKHVLSGINPQGCDVHSFAKPSTLELSHDFMWRAVNVLPARGKIGIFNRSYYEEVLVVRVQPDILKAQRLPEHLVTKDIWTDRLQDIANFESYLARNGTQPIKFFLHVSKKEQLRRLIERIDDPDKRWKFDMADVAAREQWDAFMDAYEDAIRRTATPDAPWYVVPADNKWFTRLVIAAAMVEHLEALDLKYPKLDAQAVKELEKVRQGLLATNGLDQSIARKS